MKYCKECGKPSREMCQHCIKMQIGENHASIYRINSHIKELQKLCKHSFVNTELGLSAYCKCDNCGLVKVDRDSY